MLESMVNPTPEPLAFEEGRKFNDSEFWPEYLGENLALAILYVPYSLDSGTFPPCAEITASGSHDWRTNSVRGG